MGTASITAPREADWGERRAVSPGLLRSGWEREGGGQEAAAFPFPGLWLGWAMNRERK